MTLDSIRNSCDVFLKCFKCEIQVKAEDSKERKEDPEKEARTVFVGNLPVTCKKQELKKIFGDFGKIEAIRFRCATRPDLKTTKKVRRPFLQLTKTLG